MMTKQQIRAHMVASRMPPLALATPDAQRQHALRRARERYAGRPLLVRGWKKSTNAVSGAAAQRDRLVTEETRRRMGASRRAHNYHRNKERSRAASKGNHTYPPITLASPEARARNQWNAPWRVRRREREQEKRVARMRLRLVRQLCRLLRRRIARAEVRDPVYGGKPQWQGGIPCASLAEAMFVGVMLSRGREIRRYTGPPLPWRDADGRERAWSPDFQETRTGTLFEVKGINELPTFPKPEQVAANREWFADVVWKCRAHPDVVLWNGRSAATQREYQRAVRDGLVTASVPMSAAEFCVATG